MGSRRNKEAVCLASRQWHLLSIYLPILRGSPCPILAHMETKPNPLTAKLFNLKFHPLEVVSR